MVVACLDQFGPHPASAAETHRPHREISGTTELFFFLMVVTDRTGLKDLLQLLVFVTRSWLLKFVHSLEHCVLHITLSRSDANRNIYRSFRLVRESEEENF
jgi:hypothetical protein